ncbi:unnamed protein product, partial [Ixodes hexagonus]
MASQAMTVTPEIAAEIRDPEAEPLPEFVDEGADAPDDVDVEAEPEAPLSLLGRLGTLPSVVTLWDAAVRTYGRVKSSSRLVGTTLRLVECTVEVVVVRGKPVAEKFSNQLSYIDGLACRGLDKVQAVYPDITRKLPQEIVYDAWQFGRKKCTDAKDYGISKVQDIEAVSAKTLHAIAHPVQTVSTCSQEILRRSCKVLEAADAALDRHMTERGLAVPSGPSAHVTEALAVLKLFDSVAHKAQACARLYISDQAAALDRRAREALVSLNYFVTGPLNSPEILTLRQVCQFLDNKIMTFLVEPPLIFAYFVFTCADSCCLGLLTHLV